MMQGVLVELLLDSSNKEEVEIRLDEDLKILQLEVRSTSRKIKLRDVRWVGRLEDTEALPQTDTGVDKRLCVVFCQNRGRFLCFKFDHPGQAAFFGICMRVVVKAARGGKLGSPRGDLSPRHSPRQSPGR